jgi:hypothetical protein
MLPECQVKFHDGAILQNVWCARVISVSTRTDTSVIHDLFNIPDSYSGSFPQLLGNSLWLSQ